MATTESVKGQVVDALPKRIKELRFGIASPQDFIKQGVIEVCDRDLYDLSRDRAPNEHGPLDPRLGLSSKVGHCETCGEPLQTCMGHFGYVKLALPVLHIGYLKFIVHILQVICKDCSQILLPETARRKYLKAFRRPNIDNLRKTQICKKVSKDARKVYICPHCGGHNGKVKKNGTGPLKITHEPFSHFEGSKALKKESPEAKVDFETSFNTMKKVNPEIERNLKKALDDLNPIRILRLFSKISASDCELLGMNPKEGRPEMFIWRYFPVSPICLRPTVPQEGSTTEDDITSKISDIVHINNLIQRGLDRGERIATLMEQWDFLQAQVAMIVNSESPGVTPPGQYVAMRGFCQRLKGKQGRFRGNLSGKRVDFSGRTVISPDPNLGVNEVAIPVQVAKNMTFPERVTHHNIEKLRQAVLRGVRRWPGANYITKGSSGIKQFLKFGEPKRQADALRVGDIVDRHLEDGDVVLFNRQPSLHKLSIMAHHVRVRPSRTFRLNECVCTPYNADFDGDEMNLHVPQTEEARAEALELMGVKHNLVTPRNGEPIIAAIQDFITGAYLLSNKDNFFDRKTFVQLCSYMVQGSEQIDLPPPAVLKPVMLWTGKQVFNVLLMPNSSYSILINLEAPCREYRVNPHIHHDMNEKDSWLCIQNSEIMCGVMDKSTVGVGKKDSIFSALLRDFGEDAAVGAMSRLARLISRYLSSQGFSIGVADVSPGAKLDQIKNDLIEKSYAECDDLIERFGKGKLDRAGGVDEEQTLETSISGILTRVRRLAGDQCVAELSNHNAAMLMAACASKGSALNVSQMVAVVGQQIINQHRVHDGFQDRTLPHFPKNARQPPSRGFVRNSFYSGLNPSEFFFHAMSGREGLVDTAVKTAETGYMSRRLMKSLEDLSVQYDDTVRNSSGAIVQFQYGDDKLDPSNMEGKAKPVNFEHAYKHIQAVANHSGERAVMPSEVASAAEQRLAPLRSSLRRKSLRSQEEIQYWDPEDENVDDKENRRQFVKSIEDFLLKRANHQEALYSRLSGLGQPNRKSRKRTTSGRARADLPREYIERTDKFQGSTISSFIDHCLEKYEKAVAEPGTGVGAIGAQSIGEPGTQMTLKTFHFAGIANLQITQGVPRIKEIINASREISTPILTCELEAQKDPRAARVVKGQIAQAYLRDIICHIDDVCTPTSVYLEIKIDLEEVSRLGLYDIKLKTIGERITKTRKLGVTPNEIHLYKEFIRIDIYSPEHEDRSSKMKVKDGTQVYYRLQHVKRLLLDIPVSGYPGSTRAIIKKDADSKHTIIVEGYGLRSCLTTPGIDGLRTRTNSVMEVLDVLGIEAARATIIEEISTVMGDMNIDPRHMQLLADVMTYRGEVLGITRFGLSKMRDSVLQLASFEKTPDHLFEAAWHAKRDKIEGVSECIIMGQSITQGTGAFRVVKKLDDVPTQGPGARRKRPLFESAWAQLERDLTKS